jgi:hypothetical protein
MRTLLILGLLATPALAAPSKPATSKPATTKRSDDPSAPRAALLMYDKLVGPHDAARARELYYARTTRERAIADALAKADGALANLRAQAVAKYDPDIADAMLHILKASTTSDINDAKIKVTGDTASVLYPGSEEPTEMVKVNGEWKVSVKGMLAGPNPNPRRFREALRKLTGLIDKVADKIQQGQFGGPEDASRELISAREAVFPTLPDDEP